MLEQKQAVADCMNRLYRQGLTTTSGGNVSLRIGDDLLLVTPSATDKGRMTAEQIVEMGLDGANRTPQHTSRSQSLTEGIQRPGGLATPDDLATCIRFSGETPLHLEIYRRRPDVRAIVHAHPPVASAFTAVDRQLNVRLIAESYAILGEPAVAPYALTGTAELAEAVASALVGSTCCVLMKNHGVLTVGSTLLEAFDRLEVLENAAKITLLVSQLGTAVELNPQQLAELDRWAGRTG